MLITLALCAWAEPPRAEMYASWAGSADRGFGVLAIQPALVRGEDAEAAVVLRASASNLYYTYMDGEDLTRVRSPGVTLGPGFSWTPEDFTLSASVGFESRHTTRIPATGAARSELELDVSLSGQVQWRPRQIASVYALGSFSAQYENLWLRGGAMRSIIPLNRRGTDLSLWLGGEGSTVGNEDSRVVELNGVAEVPVRQLNTTFSIRGGAAMFELGGEQIRQPSIGVGIYWRY